MGAAARNETADKAKTMTSLVNWVLLGLVIARPSNTLELAHRFQRVYKDLLPIGSNSHIYGALDALKSRGMVEIVPGTEIGRQPRLHYQATPFGVRSFEDWVVAQVDDELRRQELWVRQLEIFAGDPAAALRMVDRIERRFMQGAGQIGPPDGSAASRAELIDELVAEWRRLAADRTLPWFRFTRERFEALAEKPQTHDPPRT